MSRQVQFDQHGDPSVLAIRDVPEPHAGDGQIRVRVHAAGLNPVDAKIFSGGPAASRYSVEFPSGNGNDYAGTIDEVGAGVTQWAVGDEVLGGARMSAQSHHVVVPADSAVRRPAGLSIEQAGALDVVGRTAWASVAAIAPKEGDTVLVSAAAGGVGVLAAQLARRAGAVVIGTASEANHEFLRSLGIIPVVYGDGLVERVRALAPQGVTAALDNHGRDTVDAALALGVPAARINTIADYAAPAEYGTRAVGGSQATPADLARVASLIADGSLVFPIDSTYPLAEVQAAYRHLLAGHVRGKIVLLMA
jgi:enoyl reductase